MKIVFEINKVTDDDRRATEEDYKRHFRPDEIEVAKEIFTTYNPKTGVFKG